MINYGLGHRINIEKHLLFMPNGNLKMVLVLGILL